MSFTLLLLLLTCHWIADYTHLQTPWMLKAKAVGMPLFPIFVHAGVHAILQGTVLLFFVSGEKWVYLFILQWASHFVIDVWKGRMNGWFPTLKNPSNQWHWVIFGFDQYLHQIVIVIIAWGAAS
ncbi:MAG: DUF3307 domain-containing protein [Spirosomataceae bacterium]